MSSQQFEVIQGVAFFVVLGIILLTVVGLWVARERAEEKAEAEAEAEKRVSERLERHTRPQAIQVLPPMQTRVLQGPDNLLSALERAALERVKSTATRAEWDDGNDGA